MSLQTIHQWLFNIHMNSKSQLHIFGADQQLFGKRLKKNVMTFYTEKSDDYHNTYQKSTHICLLMLSSQVW